MITKEERTMYKSLSGKLYTTINDAARDNLEYRLGSVGVHRNTINDILAYRKPIHDAMKEWEEEVNNG